MKNSNSPLSRRKTRTAHISRVAISSFLWLSIIIPLSSSAEPVVSLIQAPGPANNQQASKAEDFINSGDLLVIMGQFDEAIADYNAALQLEPQNVFALAGRGEAMGGKGLYTKALDDYNKACFLNRTEVYLFSSRGNLFMKMAKAESKNRSINVLNAIRDYETAAQLDKSNIVVPSQQGEARLLLGDTFQDPASKKGEYLNAITYFNTSIERGPKFAQAYAGRAAARLKLGEIDEALKDAAKAVEYEQRLPQIFDLRGQIYSEKKEYEKAIEDHTKAIALDPKNPDSYKLRADAYFKLNKYAQSSADYRTATNLRNANAPLNSLPKNEK